MTTLFFRNVRNDTLWVVFASSTRSIRHRDLSINWTRHEKNTRNDKNCELCTRIFSEKLKLFKKKLKLRSRRIFTQENSIFVSLYVAECVTLARVSENCHPYQFLCNLWFSNVLPSGFFSCLAVHSLELMLWTVKIIRSAATLSTMPRIIACRLSFRTKDNIIMLYICHNSSWVLTNIICQRYQWISFAT